MACGSPCLKIILICVSTDWHMIEYQNPPTIGRIFELAEMNRHFKALLLKMQDRNAKACAKRMEDHVTEYRHEPTYKKLPYAEWIKSFDIAIEHIITPPPMTVLRQSPAALPPQITGQILIFFK